MVFQIVSVVVPVIVFFIALAIVKRLGGDPKKYIKWLVAACLVFFISWYLPSPLIDGQDTSLTTHFVGGGVFSGLFWLYLKQSFKWRAVWWLEVLSLFALVSLLGAINELFEIVLYKLGGMPHGIADTSWDILANTLGAALFYVVYFTVPTSDNTKNSKK